MRPTHAETDVAEQPALAERTLLVQRALRGFEQRAVVGPHDHARGPLDQQIIATLEQLSRTLDTTVPAPSDAPPPRRISVALAMSILCHPHLAATYGPGERAGTTDPGDRPAFPAEAPLVISDELLQMTVGLSQWELDDLREDIDRRASQSFKQTRVLSWLWTHFSIQEGASLKLFKVLFPGIDASEDQVDLVRRANRLYGLYDMPSPGISALFLGWKDTDEPNTIPISSFHSRYVDPGLRKRLARSIGAEPWEVDRLLDRMVTLLPEANAHQFLERDQWRTSGLAGLTELGRDYLTGLSVVKKVDHHQLEWNRWLEVEAGELRVTRKAAAVFDEFALDRAQQVLSHIYAGMLARVEHAEPETPFELEDLDLLDIGRHLRHALNPMVAWAVADDTHAHIAAQLRLPVDHVADVMNDVGAAWRAHAEAAWYAPPGESRRHTISGIVFAHLIALRGSLMRIVHRNADPRWDHRNMALLFTAHYLADAPIERLWMKGLSDSLIDDTSKLPPPEDVTGTWFWSCWMRLLDIMDSESGPTISML